MEQSLVFIALGSEDWGAYPKGQHASTCSLAAMFFFRVGGPETPFYKWFRGA